jgi:threonyl-tRNA synthetase
MIHNMTNHNPDLEIQRRHSASHIMTAAVKMLYPDVKLGVGPWTDDGFYQDFDFGDVTISDKAFKKIEKKMRWIVNKNFQIKRHIVTPEQALEIFGKDPFKQELIREIIDRGEEISFYNFENEEGKAFYHDLCAGPHLASTGQLGVFKLTKLAAAYWRGDADKETLTRIYGVAFETQEEMMQYEKFLEEAAKRDHRKLGKELDLFCFSEKVGPGLPLFTPKGTFIKEKLQQTVEAICRKYGFEKVFTPHFAKIDLYETSGHAQKFSGELFGVNGHYKTQYCIKPVQCPHHTQIYDSRPRSYKDLPIRYMESERQYRDEKPGQIGGLTRVIAITCEDGHIFCRPDQIETECKNLVKIIREFYQSFGMWGDHWVSLSLRDPEKPENYIGTEENWKKAENFLEKICADEDLEAKKMPGEAALYGPKIDFMFRDALGNERQLATVQLDFATPERFGLTYIDKDGTKKPPVMIHRAILGSYERFLAILIEHFAGAFPAWLAPVQAHIIPVNAAHEDFAQDLAQKLRDQNARIEIYDASDSLGKRIRNCQTAKIPFAIIIGDKEIESGKLTIRKYGEQKDQEISIEAFLKLLK